MEMFGKNITKRVDFYLCRDWAGHSAGTYDAFNVVDPGWSHYNDQHLHEWSVWFDGTDKFYLIFRRS